MKLITALLLTLSLSAVHPVSAQIAPDRPNCIENATGRQCPLIPGSHRDNVNPPMDDREGVPHSYGTGSR